MQPDSVRCLKQLERDACHRHNRIEISCRSEKILSYFCGTFLFVSLLYLHLWFSQDEQRRGGKHSVFHLSSLPHPAMSHLPCRFQLKWPQFFLRDKTQIKPPISFLCKFMVWLMKPLSARRAGNGLIRASGMKRGPLDQRLPAHFRLSVATNLLYMVDGFSNWLIDWPADQTDWPELFCLFGVFFFSMTPCSHSVICYFSSKWTLTWSDVSINRHFFSI